MPFVIVDGQTVYYEVIGNGPVPVLLVPGYLGTIELDFAQLIPALNKEEFKWIAVDPPGYGKSRPPDLFHGLEMYHVQARILARFMEILGYKRYSIIGWSQGGSVGMLIAGSHPDRVIKLGFWGCFAHQTKRLLQFYKMCADLESWDKVKLAEKLLHFSRDYLQKICSEMLETSKTMVNTMGGKMYGDRLSNVTCPTLIMHGNKDRLVDEAHPKILNSAYKNSRVHYFPEGGHDLHLTHRAKFVQVVEDFLLNRE